MCGASLISTGVVLTSGHCVNHTDSLQGKLMVRCGEWDTHGEVEELKHQQIDVKTILVSCLHVYCSRGNSLINSDVEFLMCNFILFLETPGF